MATVGHDFEPYARWLEQRGIARTHVRVVPGRVHRAGVHHHRPGRQPDHRLPSRRDESCAPSTSVDDARRRAASASSRPTAARACSSTPRSSPRPASRSSSIPARGCRCSTARNCAHFIGAGRLGRGQRLRGAACCRERTGWYGRADRRAGQGADRHARRRGLVDLRRRPAASRSRRRAPRSWPTRPAAATPIAPACCTACSAAWTGTTTGRIAVAARAPSRSSTTAPSNTPIHWRELRRALSRQAIRVRMP